MEVIRMKYNEYNENYLLEYSGNDRDNEEFAKLMNDFEKIFKYYIACDSIISDMIDFASDTSKYKFKKSDDMQKFLNSVYDKSTETNKKLQDSLKILEDVNIKNTVTRFEKLIKKFSVKYSQITLDDKKTYTKKFKSYFTELLNIYNKYDSLAWAQKVNSSLSDAKKIDIDKHARIVAIINAWLDVFWKYTSTDLNNIRYVTIKIDPSIENTFKFQVVQFFLRK
jgi:hypothetical protein